MYIVKCQDVGWCRDWSILLDDYQRHRSRAAVGHPLEAASVSEIP